MIPPKSRQGTCSKHGDDVELNKALELVKSDVGWLVDGIGCDICLGETATDMRGTRLIGGKSVGKAKLSRTGINALGCSGLILGLGS